MKDTQRTLRENWHGVLPRIGEVLILATFVLSILFANDVREATVRAFHFSLSVILPSIFPFTVLSGVYTGLQMSTQSTRGRRVARVLGVRVGTVKSRISRARDGVKEFLEKRNFFG